MKLPFVSRKAYEELQSQLEELDLEYRNYRRRNQDLKDTAYIQGKSDTLRELLSVYDNLLLALAQPCQDEAFLKGIRMTMEGMVKTLGTMGVTEIPALGEPFE